ncbi:MAG: hypothetical protein H6896_04140 [Rhodovulum sp.]|nr:hypothetical protein [Rhodovulum sp.]
MQRNPPTAAKDKPAPAARKAERLAEALRANLARRKAQKRARSGAAGARDQQD